MLRLAAPATLAVALCLAAPASGQNVPQTAPVPLDSGEQVGAIIMVDMRGENFFLVINNMSQSLTCTSRAPDGAWQRWFDVPSAANWQGTSRSNKILFFCRPPVAPVAYTLKPGKRYSLIPDGAGVKLVEVVTGHVR